MEGESGIVNWTNFTNLKIRVRYRSALGLIIDQYMISTDNLAGITIDPNREDDPQYILWFDMEYLLVSLETWTMGESTFLGRAFFRPLDRPFVSDALLEIGNLCKDGPFYLL
jgi:hypothetical protein